MNLPLDFITKYQKILNDEAKEFFGTFDAKEEAGFRVNPMKSIPPNIMNPMDKISNSHWGYYGKISGKSSEFLTGVVYSQEPSAQIVGSLCAPSPGMRVLDLCAAPGGKSTHLLSYLMNTGVLVANDVSAKRSKILVENLERWGTRNTVVLNEEPLNLIKAFEQYFDLIVLDVPCSGEGMFRKDPKSIQYWSQNYVKNCAARQREIFQIAMKLLAPGGSIVYSTCTWAPEEDEENVRYFLEKYSRLILMEEHKLWPHQHRGEGQYVAKFTDTQEKVHRKIKSGVSNLTHEQKHLWQEFSEKNLLINFDNLLQVFGDTLYFVPADIPNLSQLKIARNGLQLGIFKKNRFEPSYALGLALSPNEVKRHITFDETQFAAYVRGEAISLSATQTQSNGWVQVLFQGNGIGFAKISNNTVKNYYPKGLRLRGNL